MRDGVITFLAIIGITLGLTEVAKRNARKGETMLKRDEVGSANSCLNKACDGEMIFVLRAKDPCAGNTIRDWVARRLALGMNESSDDKIQEALACAAEMDRQYREIHLGSD